ncbi:E3 ubiquitin-protein ligase MARCH7 isoform X2 [Electrophorus electricus]|uniref:RING-type E3 ubiquitin transferase n=2 Tax=Electrophorus electricus TaxID=8005 RepID=A0AAY5ESZ4_ELEEL|nr:E3 ubiquitin-protein ligase MARCH7 isoform X2 [Electrophorus electricus]XP_035382837.1 E3 ubiquitin-protein ligase MARCH7 isoform X2 [Electrophorus electricus]
MDSKSRRLPFSVSGPSSLSSPTSISSSSSSTLGAGRLYGRAGVLATDSLSRGTVGKLDPDYQSPCLPGISKDYISSESSHSRWRLSTPHSSSSSSSPTVSRDRPWAGSSYSGRSKPLNVDSERRLGSYSGLLCASQDSESKRAKLSYTSRAAYSRNLPPSSARGCSTRASLGSMPDSLWKSTISPLSRSSSASSSSSAEGLWYRREPEKRSEPNQSSLGEPSYRPTVLTSSLYRPERVTSTYAQGARPKEGLYSSRRESSTSSRHLATDFLPSPLHRSSRRLASDYSPSSRLSRDTPVSSSSQTSASFSDPSFLYSSSSSPYTPLSERHSSPPQPSPTPVPAPCPAPEDGEPDGRSTTRRLLSRLFSRRSSQESGSASSSNSASRSFDSTSEEASPSETMPTLSSRESTEEEPRSSDPVQAFAFLRRREQNLAPVRATVGPEVESVRAPGGLPWLNWYRYTPLFSRRRRDGRDEGARAEPRSSRSLPLTSPDRQKTAERDPCHDEAEQEEDEEEEGATAAPPAGASTVSSALVQETSRLPGRSPVAARVMSSPLFRLPENVIIGLDVGVEGRSQADAQAKEKPTPSRDPEKLRKIQESLLLEESDEDEGDLCRICQMKEESSSNPLIEPCRCTGSLQYVHQDCIKQWLRSKISSGSTLEAITTCELCKEKLHLDIENFDINELYRSHERSEYEFISCGLYLVVLLHLCEQRFSDVLGAVNEAGAPTLSLTKRMYRTTGRPLTSPTWTTRERRKRSSSLDKDRGGRTSTSRQSTWTLLSSAQRLIGAQRPHLDIDHSPTQDSRYADGLVGGWPHPPRFSLFLCLKLPSAQPSFVEREVRTMGGVCGEGAQTMLRRGVLWMGTSMWIRNGKL